MAKKSDELRRRAEEILLLRKEIKNRDLADLKTDHILEELSIYQIELELQNEELLKRQTELENSKNDYKILFDSAPNGYLVIDDGLIILNCNLTFANMIGKSRQRVINSNLSEYLHPSFQDIVYLHFNKLFKTKGDSSFEVGFKTPGGGVLTTKLDGKLLQNNESKIVRISIVDISELKNTENSLHQKSEDYQVLNEELESSLKLTVMLNQELMIAKEKAEESDRLKSAFLANMSHEIRTPMNGIMGFAHLLKAPELEGEKQKHYLSIIEQSGTRLLNIINDIIDISKIESGLMDIHISQTNINEQIEFLYKFFKPEVESKGMRLFHKEYFPSEKAIINSDSEKIYAILTNLVKNAIKYSNEGYIEFGYMINQPGASTGFFLEPTSHEPVGHLFGESADPAELLFYVKDTGIGIPAENHQSIFDRFVQVDNSSKKVFQGAGLGLSITKAYVEMLGGKIWVQSKEDLGSEFCFTIPYNVQKAEIKKVYDQSRIVSKADEQKKLKILIAEDDDSSGCLLTELLQNHSHSISHVKSGIEALYFCQNHKDIDLILMDIKMPKMNGLEATMKIREFNKDIIIIAQTAYGLVDDREKALAAGCNDYISKPINQNLLIEIINKYLYIEHV
jgi:PAS domain S-box-containing protein